MRWLFGADVPPPQPKPKPKPECPPGGNMSLIPKLRHRDVGYSGFVFQLGEGWMGSHHERRWAVLRGPQVGRELAISTDPMDEVPPRLLPVKGATVEKVCDRDQDDVFEFRIWSTVAGYSERFCCGSEEDRAQWVARLSVAAYQATESRALEGAAELCSEWLRAIEAGPQRLVPPLDPGQPPERKYAAVVQGYVTCRHESESLLGSVLGFGGADWKRRWVVVHDACLTVRDDRASAQGVKVLPLRDTTAEYGAVDGHPWSFVISGPFIPDLTMTFDSKEKYAEWRSAVIRAARANSVAITDAEDVGSIVSAEIVEIESTA